MWLILIEQKIVEDLLASLGREELNPRSGSERRTVPSRGCHYLHVRFGRGSAFLDQSLLSSDTSEKKGTIVFSAFLFGQRFSSKPVPASIEPEVDDAFLFEKPQGIDRQSLHKVCFLRTWGQSLRPRLVVCPPLIKSNRLLT